MRTMSLKDTHKATTYGLIFIGPPIILIVE